ncbi:MAG: hypothetical protein ACLP1X_21425 [Polyangiaceae bacterium]
MVAFDLRHQVREFPEGSYLAIRALPRTETGDVAPNGWRRAKDLFAQLTALVELEFPGIAPAVEYEGTMASPVMSTFRVPEEGLLLDRPRAYPPGDVEDTLQARADHLATLSERDVSRFTLAARWFRRANDAENSIDKVLFYYTVLETLPKPGKKSEVPNAVARFLVERGYPSLDPQMVKTQLNLGRICGFRGEVVHYGKANVEDSERTVVKDHVDRLRAIAGTCMRLLAGMPPGGELDRFLRGGEST